MLKHTKEVKIKESRAYLYGKCSYAELGERYGINDISCLRMWVKRYEANGAQGFANRYNFYPAWYKKEEIIVELKSGLIGKREGEDSRFWYYRSMTGVLMDKKRGSRRKKSLEEMSEHERLLEEKGLLKIEVELWALVRAQESGKRPGLNTGQRSLSPC